MKEKKYIILSAGKKNSDKINVFMRKQVEKGKNGIKKFFDGVNKHSGIAKRQFSYIETFIKDRQVAAIHPSSKYLVKRVVKAMDLGRCGTVVEFGPAEGVITSKILKELDKSGCLVAIERNEDFCRVLRKINDGRIIPVNGDVRDFKDILDRLGISGADCVVSGIPFSFLAPEERVRLLRDIHSRLNHNGRFVAYQVTTHLIPLIKKQFPTVRVEFEVRNFPPHFIFTAFKK